MSISRDQMDASSKSSLQYSRGIELAERGWLDEAINEFRKAIKSDPNSAQGHDNLATVYADKGDLIGALSSYVQALSLDAKNPYALHNLGCFLSNHASILAASCFKNAFKIEPEFFESRFNLALCLATEGRHEQAIPHFERALAESNFDPEIRFHLALSHMELAKYVLAIKEFMRVVKDDEHNDLAWFNLGSCYQEQGFLEEAENSFAKSVTENPNNIDAILSLASLLARLKRKKESNTLIKRALRLDKKLAEDFITHDEYLYKGKL